jgi:hypothetical protein
MMNPFNHDYLHVQRYLHELRAQAVEDRLARQAAPPRRPRRTLRRLRLHVAAWLVAVGEMLLGCAEEQAETMVSAADTWQERCCPHPQEGRRYSEVAVAPACGSCVRSRATATACASGSSCPASQACSYPSTPRSVRAPTALCS